MLVSMESAKIAAQWWADKLNNRSFDNGATDSANAMARLLGGMLAAQAGEATEQEAEAFRDALVAEIAKLPAGYGSSVNVDYHPDITLVRAMQASGTEKFAKALPWKSSTHIKENGDVFAKQGYGATPVALSPKEEEKNDAADKS